MPKKKGGKKDKGPDPNNPFDMVMAQPEQILDLVAMRQKLEASLNDGLLLFLAYLWIFLLRLNSYLSINHYF